MSDKTEMSAPRYVATVLMVAGIVIAIGLAFPKVRNYLWLLAATPIL